MRNQKGVSLIEVLATLTILMIISTIIYSVFFSVNKNYNQISSKTNLEQEANIIISTIKSYHLKQAQYNLSYDSTLKKAFIGITTPSTQLERSDIDITNFKIVYNNTIFTNGTMPITDTSKSLNITIQLSDKLGQTYSTNTIIKRY